MSTVAAIRARRRQQRLDALRRSCQALIGPSADQEVWLFGSLARGDWDAILMAGGALP